MTLIIIWRDKKTIHMASDSRVTVKENSYADLAIKISSIPCLIHGPLDQDTRFSHRFDLGMAFAGSHLNAAVIKGSLEEILKNIQAAPGYTEFSMDKIIKVCFWGYRNISKKICETAIGKNGIAELYLAGYCEKAKSLRAFRFWTDAKTNEHFYEEAIKNIGDISISGSGKNEAEMRTLNPVSWLSKRK